MIQYNNRLALLLILSLQMAANLKSYCQVDSVKTEYSKESIEKTDYIPKEKYRYFTQAHIEEKTLIKAGINLRYVVGAPNTNGIDLVGFPMVKLALERKINPSFSFLIENDTYFGMSSNFGRVTSAFHAAGRYYYNQEKKIREGRSANNFSSNYLSIQGCNLIMMGYKASYIKPHADLLYGIQRRLGKYFILDSNFGMAYFPSGYGITYEHDSNNKLAVTATFFIGFGL